MCACMQIMLFEITLETRAAPTCLDIHIYTICAVYSQPRNLQPFAIAIECINWIDSKTCALGAVFTKSQCAPFDRHPKQMTFNFIKYLLKAAFNDIIIHVHDHKSKLCHSATFHHSFFFRGVGWVALCGHSTSSVRVPDKINQQTYFQLNISSFIGICRGYCSPHQLRRLHRTPLIIYVAKVVPKSKYVIQVLICKVILACMRMWQWTHNELSGTM